MHLLSLGLMCLGMMSITVDIPINLIWKPRLKTVRNWLMIPRVSDISSGRRRQSEMRGCNPGTR